MKLDLLTVGDTFEDLIFAGLERLPNWGEELEAPGFARTHGGGALITAIAAARAGLKVGIVSALGESAEALLEGEGVTVYNLRKSDEPHALTVALSAPKDRAFVTYNPGGPGLEQRLLSHSPHWKAHHIHVAICPTKVLPWINVLDEFKARRSSLSWDFGWFPGLLEDILHQDLFTRLNFLLVNAAESLLFSRSESHVQAEAHWRKASHATVITLGAQGSVVCAKGQSIHADVTTEVSPRDTTGAGDAFNGGFLAAVLRGSPLAEALAWGNHMGALSTRALGGIDGLPTRAELEAHFL